MHVAIVEDERLAADRLADLLREIDPGITIAARLESVAAAVAWLRTNRPEILFLDIQLADGLSFAIFDQVAVDAPVVFTTAYDQYALRAFRVNSIDYLLKPVRAEDLREALAKFRGMARALRPGIPDMEELLRTMRAPEPQFKRRFLIQFGEKLRTVRIEEVAFFHALAKSVFLTTTTRQCYPVEFTLDGLAEVLDPARFFRINRKMIVGYDAIRGMVPFSRSRIKLTLEPPEPKDIEALVSVERAAAFRAWLGG